MSTNNQISVEIPKEVLTQVETKLKEVKTLLAPYLQALRADTINSLYKMGDKSVATVQKVEYYLTTNPEFAPAYMNQEEFKKDVAVVSGLTPIYNMTKQLSADLSDTIILAGSEAMVGSMLYYGFVKEAAAKGVATAKPIYDDIKQRFTRKKG